MMKKIIILFFFVITSITCSNHNSTIFLKNDYRSIYVKTQCDPNKEFPQLILIPYFEYASQLVPNCETYPVYKTALSLFIFYHQWMEHFEDHDLAVKGMLEKVMIQWGTEKRTGVRGYDINGERIKISANIIGLVETDSIIWVWRGYHHRISESSLIHELVHLALRAKNGTADPDHEGFKYRGWTSRHTRMISETKQMLRAFEL